MSYRERSIYSHRAVSSRIRLLDPVPGDGGPLKAKQKSVTKELKTGTKGTEIGAKATKTETKEQKRTPTKPGTREKRAGTGHKTGTKNKDRKSERRRPVTAVGVQRKPSLQARKPEVIESTKMLRSKKASKSSILLKREALEQPELQEVYAPDEADVLPVPSLATARVNPYQKYQELIDELNRKYEYEQSVEKIYHRHIEFSVDMGQDARRRPPRAKRVGALARSMAVTTSTLDLGGAGTPSGRGSVVELRHGEDDHQAMHQSALDLGEASMSLCSEATDRSDATGGCDSSDASDTKAMYEASSTLSRGRRFEGSELGGAISECSASLRRSLASGGGDELDTLADGTASSTRSWHRDSVTPTSSRSREDDVNDLDSNHGPLEDDVNDLDSNHAPLEDDVNDLDSNHAPLEDDCEGRDVLASRDADSAMGGGDDVDDMGEGGHEEDVAASGGSSLAGSEQAEETDDSDRGDYCLGEDDFVRDFADDRVDYRDDGSDEQDCVDVRRVQDAVSVPADGSGDEVDDEEEAAVEDGAETEDRLGQDSLGRASSVHSSYEFRDAKSTTSLPSSVLTGKWRAAVNASPVGVGVGAVTADTKSVVAVGEGGRLATSVDLNLGATHEEAQRQIAALQRQVATMRTNRMEAARRRVRALTWRRHLAHVESRLRAEQLELNDLWRQLQPLEQIARHWPQHGDEDSSGVWPVVYPPVQAACGDASVEI